MKKEPKLVKSSKKIRFPRSSTSVKNVLRDIQIGSNIQNLSHIVIITKDKDGYLGCGWSNMNHSERIALCEYAKALAIKDLMV